jgi:hypothetical protein
MTVPGRVEAAHLLRSLDPPAWHVRHSCAVAEVAGWLAARTAARGVDLDRRLTESAALLHDVDKALPPGDPLRALPHGEGSAAWLAARGYPELADPVATHPVTRLRDGEWFERWLADARPEDRIVAYADKRAAQRLGPLDARFAAWRRRHPPTEDASGGWNEAQLRAIRDRAGRLEAVVCAAAGVAPQDVRRLAWTASALRTAGSAG